MEQIHDIEDLINPKCAFPSYRICHLEKDKEYKYCNCGHSKSKAFCDETCTKINHKLTGLIFKHHKDSGNYPICLCKTTENPPYCDGSHIYAKWSKQN